MCDPYCATCSGSADSCTSCFSDSTYDGSRNTCQCNDGRHRDVHWTDRCFDDCASGYTGFNAGDHSFCQAAGNVKYYFDGLAPGWSTCYSPTFHSGRGAYFGGDGNYLRWDEFRAGTTQYFGVWIRPKSSGYVFNYNYEARPYNYDRDECDFWDDNNTLETKRGEFSFFFDECNADGEFEDGFFGWKLVTMSYSNNENYTRTISINGELYHTDSLDNAVYLVQRESGNEFFLGSYRGVHNFYEGFIYGFEFSSSGPIAYDTTGCAWATCGGQCPSMCNYDQYMGAKNCE
jgi:hypothetical protein